MNWYKTSLEHMAWRIKQFAAYEEDWQKQIDSLARNNPYPFKNLFPNGNRLYLPFNLSSETNEGVDIDVKNLLEENNFKITDYRNGYCSDGKNTLKIGKVLQKLWKQDIQDLQRKFENDEIYNLEREIESANQYYQGVINTFQNSSYRTNKKTSGFSVVISQDPHDVAKMSTDRDWTSCMELGSGQHYHDIFCEVQEGGLIAYLINSQDVNIEKPLARIRIRRFSDNKGNSVMAPEEAVYGNEVEGFKDFVKNWVKAVQGDVAEGLYYLKGGQWSDTFSSTMFIMPTNEEDIIRCWEGQVDDRQYIRYKVVDEMADEENEYGEPYSTAPQYFNTKKEAEEYANEMNNGDDSWREYHQDYWLEKDEDTDEWEYNRFEVKKEQKITKDTIKNQAAIAIANAPKGKYSQEIINQIKEWVFVDRGYSTSKREVLNTLFLKYPEIFTYEEAQMEGSSREYDFVKNMPDGPEKDMIKQNIMTNVGQRINDMGALLSANKTIGTPEIRLENNVYEYIIQPLKELFSPIPEKITTDLIAMGIKMAKGEPLGIRDEDIETMGMDNIQILYKGGLEQSISAETKMSIATKIADLLSDTSTDTPSVQKYYENLLQYWGYNQKQQSFEHTFPPYSPINLDTIGYRIGKLGENGKKFLPFLKTKLEEEKKLLEIVQSNKNSNYLYGRAVSKNVEKYLYIIDAIENRTGYSRKYRFFGAKSNNWFKLAQQEAFPYYQDTISKQPQEQYTQSVPKTIESLEELLYDVEGLPAIENILNKYGFEWEKIQFPNDIIIKITIDKKVYIIPDPNFDSRIEDSHEWLYSMFDNELYSLIPPSDFEKTFWNEIRPGYKLYHGTSSENIESIMTDGLQPRDRTRGINNRGTGLAVFTSDDPDHLDSYGDTILEIDVGHMKSDGFTPAVSKETPLEEADTREALAHRLGIYDIDFKSEYNSEGLFDNTVIFYNSIPPKYLKVME